MKKIALHWQILAALVLAVPVGLFFGPGGITDLTVPLSFMGRFFLNALTMIVVPLIIAAIITGVANIEQGSGFSRLGGKTAIYYLSTSFIAIITGLILVNIFKPGIIGGLPAKDMLALAPLTPGQLAAISGKDSSEIYNIFLRMVPPNIFKAASEGQMLGLISFSLVFGLFVRRLSASYREVQLNFWNGIYDIMLHITNLVMRIAPIGVLGLVAVTVSETGFGSIVPLLKFAAVAAAALLIHIFISTSLILYAVGRLNPFSFLRLMSRAMLTAFSTASSSATLPETIDCVKSAGVSKKVSGFVLPLGATVNMDGTALYECVAAMFIAQAYGLEISPAMQLTVVAAALLTSIGVAGIPSASLVAIVIVLKAIGLPDTAIGLILVVDRPLDMLRTAVNVWSDSCGAAVIAASEGEKIM
jgi:proton glutamate symport protein